MAFSATAGVVPRRGCDAVAEIPRLQRVWRQRRVERGGQRGAGGYRHSHRHPGCPAARSARAGRTRRDSDLAGIDWLFGDARAGRSLGLLFGARTRACRYLSWLLNSACAVVMLSFRVAGFYLHAHGVVGAVACRDNGRALVLDDHSGDRGSRAAPVGAPRPQRFRGLERIAAVSESVLAADPDRRMADRISTRPSRWRRVTWWRSRCLECWPPWW